MEKFRLMVTLTVGFGLLTASCYAQGWYNGGHNHVQPLGMQQMGGQPGQQFLGPQQMPGSHHGQFQPGRPREGYRPVMGMPRTHNHGDSGQTAGALIGGLLLGAILSQSQPQPQPQLQILAGPVYTPAGPAILTQFGWLLQTPQGLQPIPPPCQ